MSVYFFENEYISCGPLGICKHKLRKNYVKQRSHEVQVFKILAHCIISKWEVSSYQGSKNVACFIVTEPSSIKLQLFFYRME